jgi:hypothetical protein
LPLSVYVRARAPFPRHVTVRFRVRVLVVKDQNSGNLQTATRFYAWKSFKSFEKIEFFSIYATETVFEITFFGQTAGQSLHHS